MLSNPLYNPFSRVQTIAHVHPAWQASSAVGREAGSRYLDRHVAKWASGLGFRVWGFKGLRV